MIMDFGKHAPFIWSSYTIVAIALIALIAWLIWDGRHQRQALADLEARGVRRLSQSADGNEVPDQAD